MLMVLLMVFGFQEQEEFVMDVRSYSVYELYKPVAGVFRIAMLVDNTLKIPESRQKNVVIISIDDIGLIAPVGCTIKVKGNKRTLDLGNTLEFNPGVTGVWVTSKDQIKIVGIAKELVPPLTPEQKRKFFSAKDSDIYSGGGVVPEPKQKTGVGFPGGKK